MNEQEELKSAKTLGIVSLVCAFLFWPAGIVCGHLSLGKYEKLAGLIDGKELARAGLILSYIFLALTVICFIVVAVFTGAVINHPEFQEALQQGLEQAQ